MNILEKLRPGDSTEKSQIKNPEFRWEMTNDISEDRIKKVTPELFKLAQEVIEGKAVYDLILSDDASGRLVSLFLKKILDGVQEKHGQHKPDIRFIGDIPYDVHHYKDKGNTGAIYELLKKIAPTRILLVTEFISSGHRIQELTKILEELNLKFDLAVLSGNPLGIKNVKSSFHQDSRLYLGAEGSAGLDLYNYEGSGVIKKMESLFPEKKISVNTSEGKKEVVQRKINQARKDINILAQETLKELGS